MTVGLFLFPQLTEQQQQQRSVYTGYEKPDWGAQSKFGLMGVFTIPRRQNPAYWVQIHD
jgi:hypothetical protein